MLVADLRPATLRHPAGDSLGIACRPAGPGWDGTIARVVRGIDVAAVVGGDPFAVRRASPAWLCDPPGRADDSLFARRSYAAGRHRSLGLIRRTSVRSSLSVWRGRIDCQIIVQRGLAVI